MARLQAHYQENVVPSLMEQFKYSSAMQVPRLTKITLNMGVGEAVADKKAMEAAVEDLTKIAGQKPIVTNARKSVAAFKIREGWPIGCKVTLRRDRMYEFLDRLISVAFPSLTLPSFEKESTDKEKRRREDSRRELNFPRLFFSSFSLHVSLPVPFPLLLYSFLLQLFF